MLGLSVVAFLMPLMKSEQLFGAVVETLYQNVTFGVFDPRRSPGPMIDMSGTGADTLAVCVLTVATA